MSLFDFLSKKQELAITWPELTERIARIVLKMNGAGFLAAGMWSFIISVSVVTATSAQTKFTGGELSQTLDTTDHPKAKGVGVRIDFPASWSIEEARRPNTVAIAVSQGGRGLENCVVTIHSIDQLGWDRAVVAAETPQSFAAPVRLQRLAKDNGGRLLAGGAANIEGYPSRWAEVMPDVTRDGRGFYPFLLYQILYKDRVIGVLCGAGATEADEALAKFRRLSGTTFRLVVNSILIPERWR
jgi:hypothetical protein